MAPNVGADSKREAAAEEIVPPTTAAVTAPAAPAPTQEHVLNCQFSRWHPLFKHCTPRSVVLELPEDVVRYLQQDGVVLPKGFEMSSCGEGVQDDGDGEVDWANGDADDDDGGECDCNRPDFPGLHELLSDAIASLGGTVFPKLNWSCPKDAAWVNGGSLKCVLPGDVLCLIKSSTFISHDLSHAFDACTDASISRPERFTLVLRKWCTLHPSMLFRCFVRGRRLVGVCQRDCTTYYGFLEEEADRLSALLGEFFTAEVCKKFADPDCVADVYVDKRSRVWLVDINPFSAVTDSLLFDWSEDALAAPLRPPEPISHQEDETLPPGVFMRLHFDPSPPLGSGEDAVPLSSEGDVASPQTCSSSSDSHQPRQQLPPGGGGGDQASGQARGRKTNLWGVAGSTLAVGEGRDFEFRCITSRLHMVPDPMGRYRGPADVAMGTLTFGKGNGGVVELEDLIESCLRADDEA